MEISGSISDLQKILFYSILAVIAQVYLLVVLSWNKTAIIVCIVLDIVLLLAGIIDYLYFSRKIILDVSGCSFVSRRATQKYTWRELYVQHTENPPYVFKDGEIPGEGVIISKHPIPKPLRIGAMTYCRFVHPSTSVFISFISPADADKYIRASAKVEYRGFVAGKDEVLGFLRGTHVNASIKE